MMQLDPGIEETLIVAARAAREAAYCEYSGFHVGAALLADSGKHYIGSNVENSSYGVTTCAEQGALAAAIVAGEREFVAVALSADGDGPTLPCGRCRQALVEFGGQMLVLCDVRGGPPHRFALAELLPHAFTAESVTPEEDAG